MPGLTAWIWRTVSAYSQAPPSGQVVAGDAGHGRVLQAHGLHGGGDAARLVGVEVGRLAGVDLAEVAAPRALVAADEERRLAVFPALEDVGAAGFLADRVQALALHQALELGVLGTHRRARADPLGLALDGGLGVARLDAEHASAIGCDRHVGQTNPPSRRRLRGSRASHRRRRPGASPRIGTRVSTRWPRTRGRTSAMVTRRPVSTDSDVTSASSIPHGHDAVERGEVGLAVQREPVHRDAARDAHADRGDLALAALAVGARTTPRCVPRPGWRRRPRSAQVRMSASSSDPHVADDVDGRGELHDGVADELAGAVPRDATAAVDVDDGRAVDGTVPRRGASAGRVHVLVLAQEDDVLARAVGDRRVHLPLQLPRRLVGEQARAEVELVEPHAVRLTRGSAVLSGSSRGPRSPATTTSSRRSCSACSGVRPRVTIDAASSRSDATKKAERPASVMVMTCRRRSSSCGVRVTYPLRSMRARTRLIVCSVTPLAVASSRWDIGERRRWASTAWLAWFRSQLARWAFQSRSTRRAAEDSSRPTGQCAGSGEAGSSASPGTPCWSTLAPPFAVSTNTRQ